MGKDKNAAELTLEEAQNKVTELEKENALLAEKNKTLEGENSDLRVELKSQKTRLAKTEKEAIEQIKDMEGKLSAAKANRAGKPTVTIDKETYQVVYPQVNVAGKIYSAEEIVANKSLCKELLAMGTKSLKKIA